MKNFLFCFWALSALIVLTTSPAQADLPGYMKSKCNIPSNLKIGQKTPPNLKHMLGLFSGAYTIYTYTYPSGYDLTKNGQLRASILIVDVMADGNADVFIAGDNYPPWQVSASCLRAVWTYANDEFSMTIKKGTGGTRELRIKGKTLHAKTRRNRTIVIGTMTKQPLPKRW